jgi:hypothetical protein
MNPSRGLRPAWLALSILFTMMLSSCGGNSSSGTTAVTTTGSAHPTIVFDYTYDVNGFFTPARRALMDAAAATLTPRIVNTTWAAVDADTTGGGYDLAFINPSTLAVSWSHNVVIPQNQITIYLGAIDFNSSAFGPSSGDGATQLMSINNVTGNVASVLTSATQYRPINATITFDLAGIQGFTTTATRQWHFDSDGNLNTDDRSLTDPHFGDYSDFYTAAIHELGHVLGIHNPAVFNSLISLNYDPNFASAYLTQVQSDGAGGFVFTGPHATGFYYSHVGQNIPLETSTKCHWGNGVRSVTANGWTSMTYESPGPFRHGFSELEFGALQDIGYSVTSGPSLDIQLP